jgi:hypothetical protein
MHYLFGPAGTGKTQELIKYADKTGNLIVTSSATRAQFIYGEAGRLGRSIRYPVTYSEFMFFPMEQHAMINGVIFDRADEFLKFVSKGLPVVGASFRSVYIAELHED